MGNEEKERLLPYFRALEGKAIAENERQGVGRVDSAHTSGAAPQRMERK